MLVLFTIVPAVDAAEFVFTSEDAAQETCPTIFTLYQFTVINTGDEVDTYTVSKSGSAAPWALISPPGFILEPDESQTLYVYVTPAKSAQTGDYTLELTVTAGKGGTSTQSAVLSVGECHKLDISTDDTYEEICTGEVASYDLVVTNEGQWSENMRLSLAGSAAVWSSVSEEFLRLETGEFRAVSVFVNPEANEVGDFDLTLTARSLDSNAITDQKLDLKINGCYGQELSVSKNFYSLCENSDLRIPIVLKNTGTASNSYTLTLDGPEWASLESDRVLLNSGAESTVNLILFPGYGIKGKFDIEITAIPDNGDTTETVELSANILQCHGVKLSLADKEDSICPQTTKNYEIGVMNTGNVTERFGLLLNGPTWTQLDTTFVTLTPQQQESITLTVNPTTSVVPGQYAISVETTSQEASRVTDRDSMILNIAPLTSCFGVRTMAEREQIKVAYGEGTLVPIVVENQGSELSTYTFDISGDGVEFAQLNPSTIEIDGNSADTVYLYVAVPDKTEKRVYSITVSARDENGVVSSASTVWVHVTDEPEAFPITEPDEVEEPTEESIWDRITGWFASLAPPVEAPEEVEEPEEPVEEEPEEEMPEEEVEEPTEEEEPEEEEAAVMPPFDLSATGPYLYWAIVVIIIIIASYYYIRTSSKEDELTKIEKELKEEQKPSVFGKFKNWLEEDEEIEVIEQVKKPKTKKVEKGFWEKVSDWLEEDEDKQPKPKPKTKQLKLKKEAPPKKQKPKKPGMWAKFVDWLEEDEDELIRRKKADKSAKKSAKKVAKASKVVKAKPKPQPKKKGKGSWDKFKDWLEEE